jgi:putative oxidoreductase
MTFLKPYENQIYAATRIVVGLLFASHGASKLFGLFVESPAPAGIIWTAGPIELVGGLMIAVGAYASIAAFICSGTMCVAYFIAHQSRGLLPIQNEGELAALYSWVFLLIAVKGSGIWSFDGTSKG